MDKNTIVGLLLIFGLMMGFMFYNSKQTKELNEERAKAAKEMQAKQIEDLQRLAELQLDSLSNENGSTTPAQNSSTPQKTVKPFSNLELADSIADYRFETDKAIYSISKKGGYISQIELKDVYRNNGKDTSKLPLILFEGDHASLNIDLMLKDQTVIHLQDYYFLPEVNQSFHLSGDSTHLSLRLYPTDHSDTTLQNSLSQNSYIEYLYTFKPNNYKFDFKVRFVNMQPYLYPNNHLFTINWNAQLVNLEKNYDYEKGLSTLYFMDNMGDVDNLSEKDNDKKNFTSPLKWVAYKQQFFTSVIFAESSNFVSGDVEVKNFDKAEKYLLKTMNANLDFDIADFNQGDYEMSFYFGPSQYKLLKEYDLELERMIPLGWGFFLLQWINRVAIIPVFNWLETYHLNYGIIILILTIILKTVLLPVGYKTYLSQARMRALKPEIETINEKYPKQEDAAKKSQATMALYKTAGVSPMAGCLPMLLQFPILIAMFRFFPAAYELRQQSFLWATDLSSYDSILNLSFNIPFYGDHVSLFTLLMTVSTIVYTWLNNKLMSPAGNDPNQKMMRVMMYIMPVMFMF
ncbi:MAG: membrane protein insertase YidC, partial [Bacteroidales bacterium]|nr:membrane protein insertase YidC [Bacteroidales bacterium]